MPSGTAPRKAAAKLRHFHETSKSFADFYLFLPKIGVVKVIMRVWILPSHHLSDSVLSHPIFPD